MNRSKSRVDKSSKTKPGFPVLPVIIFLVGAGVLIWLIMGTLKSPTPPPSASENSATGTNFSDVLDTTNGVTAVEDTTEVPESLSDGDRQRLLGKWERMDNPPYTIEIRMVKPDGVTDALYFNPQPINVAEGFTVGKDGKLAFFMKMKDRGYEGSTYTLVYDEDQDLLAGEYFQATQRQTYDVVFQRARE